MAEAAVCRDRDMDLRVVHWILLCDLVEELCLADLSAVSALAEHVGPAWRSRDRDGGGLSRAPVELMRSPVSSLKSSISRTVTVRVLRAFSPT